MNFISEEYFMEAAYGITRRSYAVQNFTYKRRFRTFFGVDPSTCIRLWDMISEQAPIGCVPRYLLFGLLFLKAYSCEHINAALCSVSEKTFRKWSWIIVELLANIPGSPVSFPMPNIL